MPSPTARAAYALAQKHSAKLHTLHLKESALANSLRTATAVDAAAAEAELKRVRREWSAAFKAYTAAMKTYTKAVTDSRKL